MDKKANTDEFTIDIDEFREQMREYALSKTITSNDIKACYNLIEHMLLDWKVEVQRLLNSVYITNRHELYQLQFVIEHWDQLWFQEYVDVPIRPFMDMWQKLEKKHKLTKRGKRLERRV